MPVKPDFLQRFDGTSRQPREVQVNGLRELADNWHDYDIHAVNGPCGIGKSAYARAIQFALGGHIIVPQNILVDQYAADYPEVNFLKGATWYQCDDFPGMTCAEVRALTEKRCPSCPYEQAKRRARLESTFFNPMSLFYARKTPGGVKDFPVIIVDEAHSLLSMLQMTLTKSYKRSDYNYDLEKDMASEVTFLRWINRKINQLSKLQEQYMKVAPQKALEIHRELSHMQHQAEVFGESPQNFILDRQEIINPKTRKHDVEVKVTPLKVPRKVLERLLGSGVKVVLLSGTLFPTDIEEIIERAPYKFYDLPSPIPAARRPVWWMPLPTANHETPIEDYIGAINRDLAKFPNLNTIIHCSYEMQQQLIGPLSQRYGHIWANTQLNKTEIVNKFKTEGGIFLAAGCSEGIDLPDNTCRLNIILKMEFPYLGDTTVVKRMATAGGQSWYRQQALKSTIQRYGRSTRSVTDWSHTVIHDPNLFRVIRAEQSAGTVVPSYFLEAIKHAT